MVYPPSQRSLEPGTTEDRPTASPFLHRHHGTASILTRDGQAALPTDLGQRRRPLPASPGNRYSGGAAESRRALRRGLWWWTPSDGLGGAILPPAEPETLIDAWAGRAMMVPPGRAIGRLLVPSRAGSCRQCATRPPGRHTGHPNALPADP